VWLQKVKEVYGDKLKVNWKCFSLEQINAKEPGFKLWEVPEDYESRALMAFKGSIAARRQGQEAWERFHSELLEARHVRKEKIGLREVVVEAARSAGLDMPKFLKELDQPGNLKKLAQEHTEAVEEHGVFGTPTLVFQNGNAAYLKLEAVPATTQEAVRDFELLYEVIAQRPYIWEIKRPSSFQEAERRRTP